jgi:microcystin-dependent protein
MSEPFIGEISIMAFNFPPKGYAQCDGQLMAIAQNAALFSILGTTFGGNGQTTFALPDLRGRLPMNWGNSQQGNYVLGQKAGEVDHTLSTTETPAHTHPLLGAVAPAAATQRAAAGNYYGVGQSSGATVSLYATGGAASTLNPATVGPGGLGQSHSNMQPYLAVNFVIAINGIFPSRN